MRIRVKVMANGRPEGMLIVWLGSGTPLSDADITSQKIKASCGHVGMWNSDDDM